MQEFILNHFGLKKERKFLSFFYLVAKKNYVILGAMTVFVVALVFGLMNLEQIKANKEFGNHN